MKKKLFKYLYIMILLCVYLQYCPYFIACYTSGKAITYSYTLNMQAPNQFASYFVLAKDFFAILALILLSSKRTTINFYFLGFISSMVLLINYYLGSEETILLSIVAGIRSFVFFITTYIIARDLIDDEEYIKYDKFFLLIIVVQTLIVVLQFIMYGAPIQHLGFKTIRFMGFLPSSGNLGAYCVGAALLCGVCFRITHTIKCKSFFLFAAMILFMTIAAGSRGAIVQVGIILVSAVVDYAKVGIKTKLFLGGSMIAAAAYVLLNFMTEQAGRGEIMVSGSGRIVALSKVLQESNLFQLLFGHGFGKGTTALVNLRASNLIVDTTLATFIYQFGIIITACFIAKAAKFLLSLLNVYNYSLFIIGSVISITLFFLTGIPLDQIGFTVTFTYVLVRVMNGYKRRMIRY